MRLERYSKAAFYLTATVLCIVLICCALRVTRAFEETGREFNQTAVDLRVRVDHTSQNLNANLIHLDLILGRAERISRSQEAYWTMMQAKGAVTMDRANAVLVELEDTIQHTRAGSDRVSDETVQVLVELKKAIQQTNQTMQAAEKVVSDPNLPATIANINKASAQVADTSVAVTGTAQDLQGAVHAWTHPKPIVKVADWTLKAIRAVGSFLHLD